MPAAGLTLVRVDVQVVDLVVARAAARGNHSESSDLPAGDAVGPHAEAAREYPLPWGRACNPSGVLRLFPRGCSQVGGVKRQASAASNVANQRTRPRVFRGNAKGRADRL